MAAYRPQQTTMPIYTPSLTNQLDHKTDHSQCQHHHIIILHISHLLESLRYY